MEHQSDHMWPIVNQIKYCTKLSLFICKSLFGLKSKSLFGQVVKYCPAGLSELKYFTDLN